MTETADLTKAIADEWLPRALSVARRGAGARMKLITANGLEQAYLEAGSGPTVLLLHGFPDLADTYRELMEQLAGAGFRAEGSTTRTLMRDDITGGVCGT